MGVASMKEVAALGEELTVEERNLLSVAYKNVIGALRASWRIISTMESKETEDAKKNVGGVTTAYRVEIEKELKKICDDILNVLGDYLIKNASQDESKTFYYRYLAEFTTNTERKEAAEKSLASYK